jgi:hypothetical protein
MRKAVRCVGFALAMMATTAAFGQLKPRDTRRPAANAEASAAATPAPTYEFFSILDGLPLLLELHHDTEVGTNKPINVFMFVIEMQVMNSDGNFEPVGLQIHNFYTQYAQDPANALNPNNARDCRSWNYLVNTALRGHKATSPTWPYVEFTVAQGARIIQTNEDGAVFWSDDIQCWGSTDRFPPF